MAHHSSLLYFCVTDLAALDPMYCFSLRWFNGLFVRAIADSAQSSDVPTRLQLLNDFFTFFLYQNVCRSVTAQPLSSCTQTECCRDHDSACSLHVSAAEHKGPHSVPYGLHAIAVCSASIALFGPWLLPPGGTQTHTRHVCWGFLLLCRSMFEKDKLLFSFSLAFKLKLDQGLVSQQELRFLMTGAALYTRYEQLPSCSGL